MRYLVTEISPDSVTLWDRRTLQDQSHPGSGKATITIHVPGHEFNIGDEVILVVRKEPIHE